MKRIAENVLNPNRHHLSVEAKKRLGWMYLLLYEESGNVSRAARKIGISRQWLSPLKVAFERHKRDPRSLEPRSRAPRSTKNRHRIAPDVQCVIVQERKRHTWGKEKLQWVLKRDHAIEVGASTVNRYLKKHQLICPKLSERNAKAWKQKKEREQKGEPVLKVKYRPPKELKDYAPGALIEKDMKFIPKQNVSRINGKDRSRENFAYQHTMIDSFTRIRTLEYAESSDSVTATECHQRAVTRFPFPIACENTDNGSENAGAFSHELNAQDVFHFYSSVGTPTDNPRVERSHRTDDDEFYKHKGIENILKDPKRSFQEHEDTYNLIRPHQALGYLTPMEFYELWKKKPEKAHAIAKKWRAYLAKQRKRLASARRMKRAEQIEALMAFIDAKLSPQKVELEEVKLQLINRQLCSWT